MPSVVNPHPLLRIASDPCTRAVNALGLFTKLGVPYINTQYFGRSLKRTTRLLHLKGIRNQTRRFRLPKRSAITRVYRFRALDYGQSKRSRNYSGKKRTRALSVFYLFGGHSRTPLLHYRGRFQSRKTFFFLPIHCRFSYRLVGGGRYLEVGNWRRRSHV